MSISSNKDRYLLPYWLPGVSKNVNTTLIAGAGGGTAFSTTLYQTSGWCAPRDSKIERLTFHMERGVTTTPFSGTATFTVYLNNTIQSPTVVISVPVDVGALPVSAMGDFSTPIEVSEGDRVVVAVRYEQQSGANVGSISPFSVLLDLAPDGEDDTARMSPLVLVPRDMQSATDRGSASLRTINGHSVLHYPVEGVEAVFGSILPPNYAGGDLKVTWVWTVDGSPGSGTVVMDAAWERMAAGSDPTSDSFATAKNGTLTDPTGVVTNYTSAIFTQAEADGIEAGEAFRLRLRRGDGSLSNGINLFGLVVEEVAPSP